MSRGGGPRHKGPRNKHRKRPSNEGYGPVLLADLQREHAIKARKFYSGEAG